MRAVDTQLYFKKLEISGMSWGTPALGIGRNHSVTVDVPVSDYVPLLILIDSFQL